jgi:hypothetical protein
VPQDYLPPGLSGRRYYLPKDNRREQLVAERLESLRAQRDGQAAADTRPHSAPTTPGGTRDEQGEHSEKGSA